MITLPPIELTLGEASTPIAEYRDNGRLFDFTDWTGTWALTQYGSEVANGALTLTSTGQISPSFTTAQIAALAVAQADRGFTLGGSIFTATATNGTNTLNFSAAVKLFRNRTNEVRV